MRFKKLLQLVEALPSPPVKFDFLKAMVDAHHKGIGRVDVFAIQYPEPLEEAYYRLADTQRDRTSPYEEEFAVAEIAYCSTLDADPRERRYALTKELMHVFDEGEQLVDSREKFISLLKEIQNRPLSDDASPAFNSEINTRWMALIVLCPPKFRNEMIGDYDDRKIEAFEIAERLDIPEWLIPSVMGDYYTVALDRLVGGD